MDVISFQESLKILYESYVDTVDDGYRTLSYEEWLEMYCSRLIEENKQLRKS